MNIRVCVCVVCKPEVDNRYHPNLISIVINTMSKSNLMMKMTIWLTGYNSSLMEAKAGTQGRN